MKSFVLESYISTLFILFAMLDLSPCQSANGIKPVATASTRRDTKSGRDLESTGGSNYYLQHSGHEPAYDDDHSHQGMFEITEGGFLPLMINQNQVGQRRPLFMQSYPALYSHIELKKFGFEPTIPVSHGYFHHGRQGRSFLVAGYYPADTVRYYRNKNGLDANDNY